MSNLIRAELAKLSTTRTFWLYVAASLAFVPVFIAQAVLTAGSAETPALDSTEGVRNVIAAASSGGVMLLLIGIMMMAGEFRHSTATATFLVTPDRRRVVGAKLAAGVVVGLAIATAASALTLAVALPWLSARGIDVGAYTGDIGLVLLGGFLATVISAVVGVGIGSLVTNQTVAIVVTLVWMFTVESLLVAFKPEIGRWLPAGASSSLSQVATANGGLLPMWAGALLFAGYGLAFAAAGAHLMTRRDLA